MGLTQADSLGGEVPAPSQRFLGPQRRRLPRGCIGDRSANVTNFRRANAPLKLLALDYNR